MKKYLGYTRIKEKVKTRCYIDTTNLTEKDLQEIMEQLNNSRDVEKISYSRSLTKNSKLSTYKNSTFIEKNILRVVFRVYWNGEVIALLKDFKDKRKGVIESYMHNGQHADASDTIAYMTTPATPAQYNDLLKELKGVYSDYEILVVSRLS